MRLPPGRLVLGGLSLANLWLIGNWAELFNLAPGNAYYMDAGASDYVACILDVAILGLLLAGAAWAAVCSGRRWALMLARVAFIASLLIPADRLRKDVLGIEVVPFLTTLRSAGVKGVALAAAALIATGLVMRWHRRLFRMVSGVVLALSPFAMLTAGRALWIVVHDNPTRLFAPGRFASALPAPPDSSRRVVLIVFDELDQRLVFGHRPAGLALPAFDRLREEAFSAANALSPARTTQVSMPAFVTGLRLRDAVPSAPDELSLAVMDTSASVAWSRAPNVFGDARAMGLNAALVGWSHPYCRVLHAWLVSCHWRPSARALERGQEHGFAVAVLDQVAALSPWRTRRQHVNDYLSLIAASRVAVSDPSLGLVLVHLSVPHLPAIWDRERARFTTNSYTYSGYIDNLALADRALAELRSAMETAGVWERTSLVVTGDHSWREAARYDGHEDRRVPYLVRVAGETSPIAYTSALETRQTRWLAGALLNGTVSTTTAVAAWFDHRQTEAEP
ncbi:MAG: alkaline phosphatase family protein [Candidatus Binatia bacterium]